MNNKSKPPVARHEGSVFPLTDVCGTWKSLCGSPDMRIYHKNKKYKLEFTYKYNKVFTFSIYQLWGITFFDFYGMIQITYDEERDLLLLTNEGEYKRVYD